MPRRGGELEGAGKAAIDDLMRREARRATRRRNGRAAINGDEAGQQVEHRRLAGAVGPNMPVISCGLQRERDVLDRAQAAEAFADMRDFEERGHGVPRTRARMVRPSLPG